MQKAYVREAAAGIMAPTRSSTKRGTGKHMHVHIKRHESFPPIAYPVNVFKRRLFRLK